MDKEAIMLLEQILKELKAQNRLLRQISDHTSIIPSAG